MNFEIIKKVYEFIVNNGLILFILALDTVRAFIASMGIVSRNTWLGRILYGKYDAGIIKEALADLGYTKKESEDIVKMLRKEKKSFHGFPIKDTGRHLIHILSNHILEFQDEISYGLIAPQKTLSYSKYYINTMEAVHNSSELEDLSTIMIRLIDSVCKDRNIDFIIVPKGGNPLLAQSIAHRLNISVIIAKDQNDSARPPENAEEKKAFSIRYEGLEELLKKGEADKKHKGIVVDCNTSGGTQLISIVKEFNKYVDNCDYSLEHITQAFVLFKLVKINKDTGEEVKIDQQFKDVKCSLHRFFDIDEEDKRNLMQLPDDDYYENLKAIDEIIEVLQNKKRYYYKW